MGMQVHVGVIRFTEGGGTHHQLRRLVFVNRSVWDALPPSSHHLALKPFVLSSVVGEQKEDEVSPL